MLVEEIGNGSLQQTAKEKQPYETDSEAEPNDGHKSRVYTKQLTQAPVFTKATTLARMPIETDE